MKKIILLILTLCISIQMVSATYLMLDPIPLDDVHTPSCAAWTGLNPWPDEWMKVGCTESADCLDPSPVDDSSYLWIGADGKSFGRYFEAPSSYIKSNYDPGDIVLMVRAEDFGIPGIDRDTFYLQISPPVLDPSITGPGCTEGFWVNQDPYLAQPAVVAADDFTYYSRRWTLNPESGQAWTWDEIEHLYGGAYTSQYTGRPGGKISFMRLYVELE